jgi:hypothetical protein
VLVRRRVVVDELLHLGLRQLEAGPDDDVGTWGLAEPGVDLENNYFRRF